MCRIRNMRKWTSVPFSFASQRLRICEQDMLYYTYKFDTLSGRHVAYDRILYIHITYILWMKYRMFDMFVVWHIENWIVFCERIQRLHINLLHACERKSLPSYVSDCRNAMPKFTLSSNSFTIYIMARQLEGYTITA